MATTKKINETTVIKEETVTEATKAIRKFEPNDTIVVRSVTQGELLLPAKKSGILYRWSGCGDTAEVEYQDLYALKVTRSQYIYGPLFVIEDEELLADPKWKDIAALYNTMYNSSDISAILNLPVKQFRKIIAQLPKSYLESVKIEAATRIENGTFDSIQKIKILDEVCGTDFICLIH